jgi:hypothetical protein
VRDNVEIGQNHFHAGSVVVSLHIAEFFFSCLCLAFFDRHISVRHAVDFSLAGRTLIAACAEAVFIM